MHCRGKLTRVVDVPKCKQCTGSTVISRASNTFAGLMTDDSRREQHIHSAIAADLGLPPCVEDAQQFPTAPDTGGARPVRRAARRARDAAGEPDASLAAALAHVLACSNVVVFTGAGVSATAGISAFSDEGGLYERARKRFKLDTGVRLFYGSFFISRRRDCQAFLADVYAEACAAAPTATHTSIGQLQQLGVITRHVTLNIDGLHRSCPGGDSLWSPSQPSGLTVELHGSVLDVVCQACGAAAPMTQRTASLFRSKAAANPTCGACTDGLLRPRVMLYNDPEERLIIHGDVEARIAADCSAADCVVWAGISFLQSASVEHFRRVRRAHQEQAGGRRVAHIIVNPCEEAVFNLTSAVANAQQVHFLSVVAPADEFFTAWASAAASAAECRPLLTLHDSQMAEARGDGSMDRNFQASPQIVSDT